MVTKWLHLNFLVRFRWGFRLVGAINKAVEAGRVLPPSHELSQMPLYIATRLDMLHRIVKRINQECELLFEAVKKHGPEHVFTLKSEAYGFPVDEELKFNLMIDIDSFLFESYSCCDLSTKLFGLVYDHIWRSIPKKAIGKAVRDVLLEAGLDVTWFKNLDDHRNLFSHEATLYISVDLTREEEGVYDLLIMKENLHEYTDAKKFIRLSDLHRIFSGFMPAMPVIEKHLTSLYS